MTVEVGCLSNAVQCVKELAKASGGYVESTSYDNGVGRYDRSSPSASLTLRIPADKLEPIFGSVAELGKVTAKDLSSDDVTEQFVDTQARLKTKKELRNRLQALLDRAKDVKDVLAIEKELNRLQADIDSMEARLKSMKGKVDYASLRVRLTPTVSQEVPGPLGYLWKGTAWCVRKLFVWKEAEVSQN
jgi:hypothetical protein